MSEQAATTTAAAIDLGSNSFHMIVVEGNANAYRVVDRVKESVRLAAGLSQSGDIDTAARERALACLARFGERLQGLPASRVRAVGTNTLRQARNARAFIDQASRILGYPIEVIYGAEEARLIYAGVVQALDHSDPNRLVVDIGGGSTELICGRGAEPVLAESIAVGAVVLSERFFPKGRITRAAWQAAVLETRVQLEPLARRYRSYGWDRAIGASGSIKAIAKVAAREGATDEWFDAAALFEVAERLQKAGKLKTGTFAKLAKDRRPVFPGGLAVLCGVFQSLGVEAMSVSDNALREGLVNDLLGRLADRDGREAGIAVASRTYGVDVEHAARVAATVDMLLTGLDADINTRRSAGWAARVHEIGMAIAAKGYHKHGQYILKNADLPGFSRDEQRRLAAIVRLHRGKFRVDELTALPESERETVATASIALRIAALLHRARDPDVAMPARLAEVSKYHFELAFQARQLDARPLTRADLEQAQKQLAAGDIELDLAPGD